MFFSKIIRNGLIFLSISNPIYAVTHDQYQSISEWFIKHYHLSYGESFIPSHDCEVRLNMTQENFRLLIKKQNQEIQMSFFVTPIGHVHHNDYQDKLTTEVFNNELSATLYATSCETQGCSDILYPNYFLLSNDHYIELKTNDSFPMESIIGCSIK